MEWLQSYTKPLICGNNCVACEFTSACANRRACLHVREFLIHIHMRAHVYVRIRAHLCACTGGVLNCYMIFIVGILSACACVTTCFRLYVSICMDISHICDNALLYDVYSTSHHDCAIRNDIGYHHETHDYYITVYIKPESMHIHHITCDLFQLFPLTSSHGGFNDSGTLENLMEVIRFLALTIWGYIA